MKRLRNLHCNTALVRDQLVEANLLLVPWMVGRLRRQGGDLARRVSHDDAISAGNVGLLLAAERFDPARGCKFSTYAPYWIRREILAEYFERSDLVHVPKYFLVADRSQKPANPLCAAMAKRARAGCKQLVITPGFNGEETFQVVGSPSSYDDHDTVDELDKLHALLALLPPRTRQVMLWRSQGDSLKTCAGRLGLTKERVRQIQMCGTERLRKLWGV